MIFWNDFLMDDVFGPILVVPELADSSEMSDLKCRRTRLGDRSSIMEDANGNPETFSKVSIQETGQEKRLARMAGLTGLDLSHTGMEAEQHHPAESSRRRGSG